MDQKHYNRVITAVRRLLLIVCEYCGKQEARLSDGLPSRALILAGCLSCFPCYHISNV